MNKTYLTVAQIIALVSGVILCFTLIGIPLGILNMVAASKLERAKQGLENKTTIRNWSIYLIFTSVIAGIFGLLAVETETEGNQTNYSTSNLEAELVNLKNLYEKDLLTKEEYEERRKVIIERF